MAPVPKCNGVRGRRNFGYNPDLINLHRSSQVNCRLNLGRTGSQTLPRVSPYTSQKFCHWMTKLQQWFDTNICICEPNNSLTRWQCLMVLQMTWADIAFLNTCDFLTVGGAEAQVDNYPKLKALRDRVAKSPKIAEWLAKRPKSNFWMSDQQREQRRYLSRSTVFVAPLVVVIDIKYTQARLLYSISHIATLCIMLTNDILQFFQRNFCAIRSINILDVRTYVCVRWNLRGLTVDLSCLLVQQLCSWCSFNQYDNETSAFLWGDFVLFLNVRVAHFKCVHFFGSFVSFNNLEP